MSEETTLTVAVRQAATALLAQQVHNTEGVSALYQGLMAVNEEIKGTVVLGRELDELTKDLLKVSDALEAAEEDGQALKDMCKRLGADVKQVNDKLSGLNKIIPILQDVEKKVEQLADKASEVDVIMGRLRQLEADMQGLTTELKQNASKSPKDAEAGKKKSVGGRGKSSTKK